MEVNKIYLSVAGVLLLCATSLASVSWSDWTACSQTCGFGVEMRHRACPHGDHAECQVHELGQLRRCKLRECPIDGGWGTWSMWRRCSRTCGEGGTRARYRACTNPTPQYGGIVCPGNRRETKPCSSLSPCPVDGGWTNWTEWGNCKARVCRKKGYRYRTRTCSNPAPLNGGTRCDGAGSESQICSKANCKVHGGWSEWIDASPCSSTCGRSAARNQTRACDNPAPARGGKNCIGSSWKLVRCQDLDPCPSDVSSDVSSSSSFVEEVIQSSPEVIELVEEPLSSVSSVEEQGPVAFGWSSTSISGEVIAVKTTTVKADDWSSVDSGQESSSFDEAETMETTPKTSPDHVATLPNPENEGVECNPGSSLSSFC